MIVPANTDLNTLRNAAETYGITLKALSGQYYVKAELVRQLADGRWVTGDWTSALDLNVYPNFQMLYIFCDDSIESLSLMTIDQALNNYKGRQYTGVNLDIESRTLRYVFATETRHLIPRLSNCTINTLKHQSSPAKYLEHCSVGIVEANANLSSNAIASADFLYIDRGCLLVESGRFHIIQIENLDQKPVFGRAVEIVYDEELLQKWYKRGLLEREFRAGWPFFWHFNLAWTTDRKGREAGLTDPDLNRNLINTYVELLKNPSLQSHEIALQRYLAYFRSRTHWFTRLLFWINGGFYRIRRPLILTGLVLAFTVCCIKSAGAGYYSQWGELILNPLKFWSHFVLQGWDCNRPLSWPKIIAALLHPALLYLVFSAAVAIKRRFGFPKE